jgi:hypothetical protein
MVYQTLSYGIMNSSFGRNEGHIYRITAVVKVNTDIIPAAKGNIYPKPVSYGILNPMVN